MPDPNERLQDCPLNNPVCDPTACESVFDRVVVSHMTVGPTRVMWELLPTFTDTGPLEFQLQAGTTANNNADDWVDVGLPVRDQYFAFDDEQRVWGKLDFTHYRLILTTGQGVYYSTPVNGMGMLDRRSWRIAREKVRIKRRAMRVGIMGQQGYLLKRRWTGTKCPTCLDYMTQEIRNPACPDCYGTGFKCGYFYPVSCVWAELGFRASRTELDGGQTRGTINDVVVNSAMLMTDLLSEDDVWVADKSDDRYYVHKVTHTDEVRGVPITANVELRLIPFTSIIYTIAIPDQLRSHGVEDD